jgi:serine/threonine protein kinase
MNYYEKYIKYKLKYKNLKKLYGGNLYDDLLKKIHSDLNITDEKDYKHTYTRIAFFFKDNDEKQIEQYIKINEDINIILSKYYNDTDIIEKKFLKEDMIFVLVLDKITIKIYPFDKFNKLRGLYTILLQNECNNLEHIYEIMENEELQYSIVVSKTIEPIKSSSNQGSQRVLNEDNMNNDIINGALKYLHDNNWIHNDVNLDNIGYDIDKQSFVLFDFEKSYYKEIIDEESKNKDIQKIRRSFFR